VAGRRQLMQRLVAGLPATAESVVQPDHPLLFRGPDLLTVQNSALSAYFLYSARESYTAPSERSRLFLSRLALPQGAAVVLAVEDASRLHQLSTSLPLYDYILEVHPNSTRGTPSGRLTLGPAVEVVERIRPFHYERFSDAWAGTINSTERGSERRQRGMSTADYNRLRRRRAFDEDIGPLLEDVPPAAESVARARAANELPDRQRWQSAVRGLGRAATRAVELDYMIDRRGDRLTEVAAMLKRNDAYLAVHEVEVALPLTSRVFDPLKPLRAAAFAGLRDAAVDRGL
jgi:hypothetical protein